MPYQSIKLRITPAQQKKAIQGSGIRLTSDQIDNGQLVMLHPMNYKKVVNAKGGVQLVLSPGEIMHTAAYHGILPPVEEGMSGSGFFDSVWNGLKSAGKFLKDTGIGTALADVAQGVLSPVLGENVTKGLREGLRGATGVGLGPALKAAKYRITNAKGKETHHVNVMPKGQASTPVVPIGTHMTHAEKVEQWKNNVWAASPYPKRGKNKVAVGSGLYL
jgi:hypothetical protein